MPTGQQSGLADGRIDFLRSLADIVQGRIIVYNYPEIEDTVFGSYANKVCSSLLTKCVSSTLN